MVRGQEACEALLEVHLCAQPETGSFLGVAEHDARLTDPSASRAELAALEEVAARLDAVDVGALDDDTWLDVDAARRVAGFERRYLEADGHASNLELSLLPHAAIHHARLHRYDASPREAAVGAFLAAHAENLRRGVREGRTPDRDVAIAFARHLLPAAARTHEAYGAFARFVEEEIVPAARIDVRLGEAEVRVRLRDAMGIEEEPAALLAVAREELADAKERTRGLDVAALLAPRGARYEAYVDAAVRFVREHGIVAVPEDLALAFAPLPDGMADGTAVTNGPPRLVDPRSAGHVLVARDPAAHAAVAAKNLAVHEAIPGHYLQCAVWQRAFARGDAARRELVRYLPLHDEAALARGNMATMPLVEGWAVYMERTLLRHGFYDTGEERAFFAVCDAIRATRVIVDLELHAGDRPIAALAALVAEATGLSEGWAHAQILRAKRMPLQGLTYLVGARAIEALERDVGAPAEAFHRALLALGPVPPSRARRVLAS